MLRHGLVAQVCEDIVWVADVYSACEEMVG
jgi:hypothetical protein